MYGLKQNGTIIVQVSHQKNYEINFGSHCLRFEWAGDRYVETIYCGSHLLLRSATTIGEGIWPSTPPLQQLHSELDRDADLVMGLGSAGDSHWSASYERANCADVLGEDDLLDELGKTGGCVRVQVAVRVQRQPVWLGSSYVSDSKLLIRHCERGVTAVGPQFPGSQFAVCALDATCSVGFDPIERRIQLLPQKKPPSLPNTIQWKYVFVSY